ncbi:hypothetical protein [Pseudomonas syringae group sp. J248-6]|uniref:hypothetical protein n=1 Tax=Pseudomonas syringae group sp. J248-6 TaxID=3079590 RepID=UPI002913CD4D|nr:hypothetical protein [Pseudomonas syringae group sp. J248-6]MDU8542509.1 hypothetical protein [Pseudomonas syringae group sp. J248-6]
MSSMSLRSRCFHCQCAIPDGLKVREHIQPKFLDGSKANGALLVCAECSKHEAARRYLEYKVYSVSNNKEPYSNFIESMYELEVLLQVKLPDVKLDSSVAKISFASAITSMETYLSDTFINKVTGDELLLRRCVETDPEFKSRKFQLSEIFLRASSLAAEVRNYLVDVLFHNLAKVKMMYLSVLQVEFPDDLSDLYKAVEIRHDIVHRGGKDKQGVIKPIQKEEVFALIALLRGFTQGIEEQLYVNGHSGGDRV